MHTALTLATLGIIGLLSLFIIVIGLGIDENTNLEIDNNEVKARPWLFLWLIPLLGILFVFAKTSSCTDYDEIAKTSTEKWHTVYTNNINADVTVSTDDVTLNPRDTEPDFYIAARHDIYEITLHTVWGLNSLKREAQETYNVTPELIEKWICTPHGYKITESQKEYDETYLPYLQKYFKINELPWPTKIIYELRKTK